VRWQRLAIEPWKARNEFSVTMVTMESYGADKEGSLREKKREIN
jgi:hypothetical protein